MQIYDIGYDGWEFGKPVFKSEINQIIKDVQGVDCITYLKLIAKGDSSNYYYNKEDIIIDFKSLAYLVDASITIVSTKKLVMISSFIGIINLTSQIPDSI